MRIALLGDIALVGRYDLRTNPQARARLHRLSEHLSDFDLVVANLESPFTTASRSGIPKSMHVHTHPTNVSLLRDLGVDAVSIANNHINDFGRSGMDETISGLEKAGISWYGVDGRVLSIAHGGERVTLSGFACLSTNGTGYKRKGRRGVDLLTREDLERRLQEDHASDSFSLLSVHWGQEHTHLPNLEHLRLARSLAQSGRFLLHGHHPHVLQGIETVGQSVIAYSLGNCLFDDLASLDGRKRLVQLPQNRRTVILEVEISEGRVSQQKLTGFIDTDEGLLPSSEPPEEVAAYTEMLDLSEDPESYVRLRRQQVSAARDKKFGKRDIRWLRSRVSYHTIGSRLTAIPRRAWYRRVQGQF